MVLQVCASGVQLVCAPARSLWPTLASAASTLALFGAADWGLNLLLHQKGFISLLLWHTLLAFAMPLIPLAISLANALIVWRVKQSIMKTRGVSGMVQDVERACIAILAICPLYMEVPRSALSSTDDHLLRIRRYELVEDPHDLCPLELTPKKANGGPPATPLHIDQQLQDSAAPADNAKKYFKFPAADLTYSEKLKERELLLTLGLAPNYRQLRFLRSRSKFQAVVTGLQAGGYVLSVVQRLAQHLAVCPLEALVCFLSVIIILQLLLELYACSHYQRPLLLRLNHHEFAQFWAAPRPDDTESSWDRSLIARYGSIIIFSVLVVQGMLFSALSIYYSVHYMHLCHVCSVAAFLFLFSLLSSPIGFILYYKLSYDTIGLIIMVFSAPIFLSSMVIAVVSTVKHWDLFHSPTHNSFGWILPHVSSQA